MRLTEEQIKEINEECRTLDCYDQGVFTEPCYIPNNIKEQVLYSRYMTGWMPGSCWDDEDTVNEYHECDCNDRFKVLDLVLEKLNTQTSFELMGKILPLIQDVEDSDYGYYGDYSDYKVEYIILSELYEVIDKFNNK